MRIRFIFILALIFTVGCSSQGPNVDIWTAVSTGNIAELQKHIDAGTNLNEKDPVRGGTPLMVTTVTGNTEAATLLVKNGADLEIKNNEGSTALMSAVFFGYPEIVTLLLENGAQVNVKDKNGSTPMDVVAGQWSQELEGIYKMVGGMLQMQIDIERIKKVRPTIAAILKKHGGKTRSEL